jgi:hypothetical protein
MDQIVIWLRVINLVRASFFLNSIWGFDIIFDSWSGNIRRVYNVIHIMVTLHFIFLFESSQLPKLFLIIFFQSLRFNPLCQFLCLLQTRNQFILHLIPINLDIYRSLCQPFFFNLSMPYVRIKVRLWHIKNLHEFVMLLFMNILHPQLMKSFFLLLV